MRPLGDMEGLNVEEEYPAFLTRIRDFGLLWQSRLVDRTLKASRRYGSV